MYGTQYGNRTRLSALKGQRPQPIDELSINLVENIGFEPICILLAKQVSTPSRPIPHKFWYRIRVTIPSSHLERVMTSPEVECDIFGSVSGNRTQLIID